MTAFMILAFLRKHLASILAVSFALILLIGALSFWNRAQDDHRAVGDLKAQLVDSRSKEAALKAVNDAQDKNITQLENDQTMNNKLISDLQVSRNKIISDSKKRIQQVEAQDNQSADPAIRCAITGLCGHK